MHTFGIELPQIPQIQLSTGSSLQQVSLSFFRLNTPEVIEYSKKELQLLLTKDIPDKAVRDQIINLFFNGRKFHDHTDLSLYDIVCATDDAVSEENIDEERHEPNNVDILQMGKTFEEVEQRKKNADIISMTKEESATSVHKVDFEARSGKTAQRQNTLRMPALDRDEHVRTQHEEMQEYVKSIFCFCVAKISEETGVLVWAVEPDRADFQIPAWVEQKMRLINSICEYYSFFDYSEHLKESTRAFIRVHRGI